MNTRTFSKATMLITIALTVAATGSAMAQQQPMQMQGQPMKMMMGSMDISGVPRIPPVAGYAAGEPIFFIHTEVSDPELGQIMTDMMGSPVPVVPALANAPEDMLATVYAFANGLQPDGPRGPLGYQPDVFDHPPGTDGYTPLRRIMILTWGNGATPRLLKSATDVTTALQADELSAEEPGIVANMPFITWPGGQR